MSRLMALIGCFTFLAIAFLLSSNRKAINKRVVFGGLAIQAILALAVLGVPALGFEGPLKFLFTHANDAVLKIISFSDEGARFVFGSLVDTDSVGFIFAFKALPPIIFFSSLMAILYFLGIMQFIVGGLAKVMQFIMGTSGAESLAMAANIFVGQTEAPLVIKPYLKKMTHSELFTLMVGGMATVAGGVLAALVSLLHEKIPGIAGHLLTASVMSAPAALVFSKILIPETKTPETMGSLPKDSSDIKDSNIIDAAARGAGEGLHMALNVAAMVLAFVALIALLNGILALVGGWISFDSWGADLVPAALLKNGASPELSFQLILGWLFAPMAFLMGIPWEEAALSGVFLGDKVVVNEFVANIHLAQFTDQMSQRTLVILSYALCGFANFSSIAIQIGGIGVLVPERKPELAQLGMRAVIGGSFAAFMTATIAGMLI